MTSLKTITMDEVREYNSHYKYDGSEDRPYNEGAMGEFIYAIRPAYAYTEDCSGDDWRKLDIKQSHTKYGTNYIYVSDQRKLWRTRQSITEFYPCGNVYD